MFIAEPLVNDTESLNEWKYTPISLVEIINSAKMPAVPKPLPIKFQQDFLRWNILETLRFL